MGNLCRDKGNINFLAQRSTGSENSRPGAAEIPQTGGVAGGGAGVRFMRFSRPGAAMRCRVFPIFAGNRIRRMMTAVKYDNSPVRRQDRLLEEEHAAELLRSGEYGFLALGGGRGGYGVPVNYAAEGSRIYIHCAPEGEKLRRIGQDAQAVFCVVGRTAPQPERFTTEYESIMASGRRFGRVRRRGAYARPLSHRRKVFAGIRGAGGGLCAEILCPHRRAAAGYTQHDGQV